MGSATSLHCHVLVSWSEKNSFPGCFQDKRVNSHKCLALCQAHTSSQQILAITTFSLQRRVSIGSEYMGGHVGGPRRLRLLCSPSQRARPPPPGSRVHLCASFPCGAPAATASAAGKRPEPQEKISPGLAPRERLRGGSCTDCSWMCGRSLLLCHGSARMSRRRLSFDITEE